jgi:hypothetical protein
MKNILLIEPAYKNKYPPLGLMKISTFHKQKGHNVFFYKGCSAELKNKSWDRVYISTLFTFYWDITIKTIKYYYNSVGQPSNIYIGGVMATLMKDEIQDEFDVTIVDGLLNQKGKLGYKDDDEIDNILPDYSIVDQESNPLLDYSYPTNDSYIAYATRGCIRKCQFCAVPIIEPAFTNSLSIAKQVRAIKNQFGEKRHLLLMDNNILASEDFPKIINEIKSLGFAKGSKYLPRTSSRKVYLERHVDFNQGIDARLLTKEKMGLLSEIAVDPLRIAFDNIKYKNIYIEKTRLAAEYGIRTLSNYILFNFKDTPEDFYERLKINIDLNEEFSKKGFKCLIWSFPMKYSPITGDFAKNRKYIGEHWNKKYLRGIQCILLATHGVVGHKKQFFEKAFGKDVNEFLKILTLPENYIIYRRRHLENGDVDKLEDKVISLTQEQKNEFMKIVLSNDFSNSTNLTNDQNIINILGPYKLKETSSQNISNSDTTP